MKEKLLKVWANGQEADKTILTDGNADTKLRITPSADKPAVLLLEFSAPFEARAISILRKPEIPHDLFDGPRDHPPFIRLEASADGNNFNFVGNIRCPELRAMDTPATMSFAVVTATYYRLVFNSPSWLCEVELHNGPRLGGWPGKTDYTHGDGTGETPPVEAALIIDPATVIDLSSRMDNKGNLQWSPPVNTYGWTILRVGHTSTGEQCAAHPDAGAGLEIDKFRKEAVDLHFTAFLDKLLERFKPWPGQGLKGITVDSWEAGKQNWTKDFPGAFRSARGYDIVSWMPALTGRITGSVSDTERFLWDVRKTHADLLAANFYGHYRDCCHQRGLEFAAEPYGDGTFDSLQAAQYLDTPMAEFWSRYIYGSDNYSRQAASAAHIYGRKVAAAEAFTGMPATAKWTDYPYSLKAEGDYFYTIGINRLVFHTFVHQPYSTGLPGMTMGPFGTHFDRNNTWTEQAYGWTGHLTRAQYLLQQGLTVSDVCYFKGDTPGIGVPDVYTFLPQGYAGDVTGPDALLKPFTIKDGAMVLPDGMRYRLCILAPLKKILPSSLRQLKELVAAGMVLLVSSRPSQTEGRSATDETIQQIAGELYGDLDGVNVKERRFGKGKLVWGKPLQQVLEEIGVPPDFTYTAARQDAAIHYIHKIAGDTEFYFISNHRRRKEQLVASFRVSGRQPEIWNSETGGRYDAALYETVNGRTILPLSLEPAGALFVVFRKNAGAASCTSVLKDGKELFSTKPYPLSQPGLYADTQNNFTVTAWIKPDTYAHAGKSMLFHPPEGETVYGNGHAAFGLSAGQNVIRIYERKRRAAKEVLAWNHPVEVWTFVAVVYNAGKPSLYVNGKLVAANTGSGDIVHPGMGTPASLEQFSSYFEGNYTEPQLSTEALSAAAIEKLYESGLPAPAMPSGIELKQVNGRLTALAWENGHYSLDGKSTASVGETRDCATATITGPWIVRFPAGRGAPAEISLPVLQSLHKHEDPGVKYFSGTAHYIKTLSISKEYLLPGKKVFLHLGRVEVVVLVKLNGQTIGLLWKEPFMIDITGAAKAGSNELEVYITNLWPNRLIGDEQLPVENNYDVQHFIEQLPDWYVKNQPKPGKRVSFAVWHTYDSTDPLLESGLLGPVRLLVAVEKTIGEGRIVK
jgi:hypothetical protein